MSAPSTARKAGGKTLRVTKTSFSLGTLLQKLHIPEHNKDAFRSTVYVPYSP